MRCWFWGWRAKRCGRRPPSRRWPSLIAALKTKDEAARLTAIDYLGMKGEKAVDAVAALIDQLKDESPAVRAHAAEALGKIGPKAAGATGAAAETARR